MTNKGRFRILVVDNDEIVLIALERLLEKEGYDTTTAWGGAEALELLRERSFGLIVVDDYLPDIGGTRFLEQLRRAHPETPFIIIRPTVPNPGEVQQASHLGTYCVVCKRSHHEIVKAVRGCLHSPMPDALARGDTPGLRKSPEKEADLRRIAAKKV